MKNYDMTKSAQKEAAAAVAAAMQTGDEAQISQAWLDFSNALVESTIAEVSAETTATNDAQALASRGVRQLTDTERKYWEKFIAASKGSNYKQAIANIDVAFPETIIEDVFRELKEQHPLLAAVNFQNVSILTKWILSDHSSNAAVWGEINGTITKEIEGALKEINLAHNKLSSFAIIPLDMLELGPVYVDRYVRALLVESIALGLEYGIVKGKGVNEPIGLVRDIHVGVSVSETDGYPLKAAVEVTSFEPAEYGKLLATLAVTEKGNSRVVPEVTLICNQHDYFTKIMPATTVLGMDGTYKRDLFPHPTKVIVSNALANNEAILCLLDEYFFGLGSNKNGVLSYSDEFKFLEDKRAYKIKMHGNGRAYDNTCAILLDTTNLQSALIPVTIEGTL